MISSSLVKPLVGPLVSRKTQSAVRQTRRSERGTARSRLAATMLAVSALVAAVAVDEAHAAENTPNQKVARTAHQKPKRIVITAKWLTEYAWFGRLTARGRAAREDLLTPPGEAASFDHDTILLARHRHRLDRSRDSGPGLGLGRRLDRLLASTDLAFANFGSARVLAAQPHS